MKETLGEGISTLRESGERQHQRASSTGLMQVLGGPIRE